MKNLYIIDNVIQTKIKEIQYKIERHYLSINCNILHQVCVLNGAIHFFSDLMENIESLKVEYHFIKCKSYNGKESGNVEFLLDFEDNIKGKDILIVEDIIDSEKTLLEIKNRIESFNPKTLEFCSLLKKGDKSIDIKFNCFDILEKDWDKYFVGYGLDCNQMYRNSKSIYTI